MKRIIYYLFFISACLAHTSCNENEIALYNETPRINFDARARTRIFVDSDYVQKTPYIVDSFQVRIQGDLLETPRSFVVKTIPNNQNENFLEVEFEDQYLFTALDAPVQTVYYKIKRPTIMNFKTRAFGCDAVFDMGNPAHRFDEGLDKDKQMPVYAQWNLRPADWKNWVWGEYSNNKYMFMMDKLGCVLKDMKDDAPSVVEKAYQEYRAAGNPPILDDKGKEINFN